MSKTFIVDISVILNKNIRINAENEAEAIDKALKMFNDGEVKFSVVDDFTNVYVPCFPTEVK